ncbi:uncharacterized protein LOC106635965 [Copidosoma floridanum]|uniref:uncharacterized protein LOC106635965 n=1 Tax=Copidosoma floridanum TaxID=29053 RepID=UPI0006C951DF|nr:uncharacterized protein LOC106635965 [Copidosoma floridanum]
MKFTLVLAVVLVCAIAGTSQASPTEKPSTVKPAVTASKDVKDAIKNAKETAKAKKDCLKVCATNNYDPICVHDPSNATYKPRTFGNQCALETHNCEMGTKLVVKSKGECPGSDGVRLTV